MKLSIIVPVFNEETTIKQILKKVCKIRLDNLEKEIIVVEDGSTDHTREILIKFCQKNSQIRLIIQQKNQGKGTAVITGLKKATGDVFLIQDADLEYDPADYPVLLAPILKDKSRVVFGSRFLMQKGSVFKNVIFKKSKDKMILNYFGNKLLSFVASLLYRGEITDLETGYKVFTRRVYNSLKLSASGFDIEPQITAQILKNHFKIQEVPIHFYPRSYKEGKKITAKDGIIAFFVLLKYRFLK